MTYTPVIVRDHVDPRVTVEGWKKYFHAIQAILHLRNDLNSFLTAFAQVLGMPWWAYLHKMAKYCIKHFKNEVNISWNFQLNLTNFDRVIVKKLHFRDIQAGMSHSQECKIWPIGQKNASFSFLSCNFCKFQQNSVKLLAGIRPKTSFLSDFTLF